MDAVGGFGTLVGGHKVKLYVASAVLVVMWVLGAGCAQSKPKEVPPPPPPPPKVEVTIPGGSLTKDFEGVRRVAVSLCWESQANGRMVGKGFTWDGRVVDLELARPLDEVVQRDVASAFKELGFNVALVGGGVKPESSAVVKTAIEGAKADYLVIPTISAFEVSTSPMTDAPTFGTATVVVELYGPGGGLITPVMVMVNTAWTLKGDKAGPEQLRTCVEDMLKEIRKKIMNDPGLQKSLGLELPTTPASPTPTTQP